MIVTITPTPMDGTVLRWFDTDAAADCTGRPPVMTVSRNGVHVGDKDRVTPRAAAQAAEAYAELRRNRYADVRRHATHARLRRGLVPLEGGEQ